MLKFDLFTIVFTDLRLWIEICTIETLDFDGSIFFVEYQKKPVNIKLDILYLRYFFRKLVDWWYSS